MYKKFSREICTDCVELVRKDKEGAQELEEKHKVVQEILKEKFRLDLFYLFFVYILEFMIPILKTLNAKSFIRRMPYGVVISICYHIRNWQICN